MTVCLLQLQEAQNQYKQSVIKAWVHLNTQEYANKNSQYVQREFLPRTQQQTIDTPGALPQ